LRAGSTTRLKGSSGLMQNTSSGKRSTRKCVKTPKYSPDIGGMADIQYRSVRILMDDGKVSHFLSPIDPSQIEDDLVGAVWVRETLRGILDNRARWIMELHIVYDLTFSQIGEQLGISKQRVHRIIQPALAKLRAKARRGGS